MALLLTVLSTSAQTLSENQRLLGYTLGDGIDVSGAYIGTPGTYPIGAMLYPEQLSAYAGCKVVGIRFALSQSVGRTRAFIYTMQDSGLAPIVEQNQRTYAGWNTVWLNGDGYTINGDETLLYGFDYVETQAMSDAEEGALCGVGEADEDGGCLVYGDFGQGAAFYSITGIGNLCAQLIVDVSNLPRKDMAINYFDPGFRYRTAGQQLEVMVTYANTGRDDIGSYQLAFQIDDRQPLLIDRSDSIVCGQAVTVEQNLALDDMTPGTHQLTVSVTKIDGEPTNQLLTPNSSPLSATSTFVYYTDALQRQKTYVEVYNDPESTNAPFLNQGIEQMLKQRDDAIVVNVHKPGAALAVSEADYLADLYAYTYPAFTINRAYFPGESYIAYDMNDYLTVFPTDMVAGIINDMVQQDSENPAFATVEISPAYNADTRQLTVELSGDVHPQAADIFSQLALTVMLTENGVTSPQAVYNTTTGRTSFNRSYKHNHVLRQYLTAAQGDALDVTDATPNPAASAATIPGASAATIPDASASGLPRYYARYETTLPEKWNIDNLEVVAFITKAADSVTDDNVMQMDITNANAVALADLPEITAIAHHTTPNAQRPSLFTIGGQPVSTPGHGIYIVKQADGKTRKVAF